MSCAEKNTTEELCVMISHGYSERSGTTGGSDMQHDALTHDRGNACYQRQLADALVAGLGVDGALEACRDNGWQGVVGVLLDMRAAQSWRTP